MNITLSLTAFYLFSAGYALLMNCPFEPIAFATTQLSILSLPLIGLYRKTLMQENGSKEKPEAEVKAQIEFTQVGNGRLMLNVVEIEFFELKDGVLRVTDHKSNCYNIAGSLKGIYERLPPNQFYRINRNCLFNRAFIKSYSVAENSSLLVELVSGEKAKVNKNKVADFKQWWNNLESK